MPIDTDRIDELNRRLAAADPFDVLELAVAECPRLALSFSGADAALIDMALHVDPGIAVFTLDTGRLYPETYRFIERVREHYGIDIEVLFPEASAVERLVREKGLYSFYRDGHRECCAVRKVAPLRRRLATLDGWITGQRRDQSPGTRAAVEPVELDPTFATPGHPLLKFNPLARWSSAQLWQYIHDNDVPYNPLHEQGYRSIGCEPCTRPVAPHRQEREGRWWWEDPRERECGLHAGNVVAAAGQHEGG